MKRDYFYIAGIVILAVVIFFMDKCGEKREARLRNEIAKQSGMIEEGKGRYSQLIIVTNSTNSLIKELQGSLDGQFDNIRKFLKKNDERLLAFSTAYATFKGKKDSVLIFAAEPLTLADWKFKLQYPDSTNPFITYDGLIFAQSKRITGDWKFDKLKVSFILTETEKGNWNARVSAPEFVIIDSITTRALPPDKIAKTKKISFVCGLGTGYAFNDNKWLFSVSAGVKIKRMYFTSEASSQADLRLNILREF